MFYGEECVSKLIKCQLCKSKLKEAKILTCGIYCENCVTEMVRDVFETRNEFMCKFCDDIHSIPNNGFMKWKALDEFYSEELAIEDIYRGESVERLKKNLNKIHKQINALTTMVI